MKVLVKSYTMQNFGDDLFLHILFKRYPKIKFELAEVALPEQYQAFLKQYTNVQMCTKKHILSRIKGKANIIDIEKAQIKACDAVIYVGGSIFMENPSNQYNDILFTKETEFCKKNRIPYFVLSSNFGPYITTAYTEEKRRCFSLCTDVCLRDSYSYEIFKDIPTVRQAPDMSFAHTYPFVKTRPKTLGISVINLRNRNSFAMYADEYVEFIKTVVLRYLEMGYIVKFFDFCSIEKDDEMIQEIIRTIPAEYHDRCTVCHYTGNVDVFMTAFLEMEKLICTRLHSMLLGIIHKKEILPVLYSDKMKNILHDMGYQGKFVQLNHFFEDAEFVQYHIPDTIKENAQKVFGKTDEFFL